MRSTLVITGASGFVGQAIVPHLAAAGFQLVLAGRDRQRLARLYPDHEVVDYENLPEALCEARAVLHLAVCNNDRAAEPGEFRSVNVDFLVHVAEMARGAGVPLFINVTSVRALHGDAGDPYAASKREGEVALDRIEGLDHVDLRLPAVYGERFAGRLAVLNGLPKALRKPVLALAAALRPVVGAERVAAAVADLLEKGGEGEVNVADPPDGNPVYRLCKRGLDLAFVFAVIVLFWWLLAGAWLAVRLTSAGPAVFAQPRVGKGEKVFTCYKFRTMATGAPQAGTHEVSASHITPIGRILRKTKIDELPQIWNVARGEMSLVGPRPCLPGQTELIGWRRRLGVFRCRPGITGLAQVRGVDMSEPENLARLDARYCALRSLTLDIRLVLATITGGSRPT